MLGLVNKLLLFSLLVAYVFYYGFGTILLIICIIASFIFGFCFLESPTPKIWQYESCDISKGHPAIVRGMETKEVPTESSVITGSPQLDSVLNEVLNNVVRDFILSWYSTLTNDQHFPAAVRKAALKIMRKFSYRCAEADWITYLTKKLPDDFASHIRLYRTTLLRLQTSTNKKALNLNSIFFDLECAMEKTLCREGICTNREREKEHLANLADMLLYYFMEKEDYDNLPLRFLMKDLLVSQVFLTGVDLLSDPDYIDQCVIWLTREDSYTSDYFLQACRMSVNADELNAVIERINAFSAPLRGRDIGGDDDASIKAQLSSLEYLKTVCTERLKRLEKGLSLEKLDEEEVFQPNRVLYNMPFQQLMDTDLAVVAFLEFLDGINMQYLLQMCLRIDSYRIAARQKLSAGSNPPTLGGGGGGGSTLNAQGDDVRRMATEIYNDFREKAMQNHHFDSTFLGEYLFKVKHKPPSENIFDELQKKLYEILEKEEYFGEFKRSPGYVELLREMDLLRDPSNPIGSEDDSGTNQGEKEALLNVRENPLATGSNNQSDNQGTLFANITSSEMTADGYVLYTIQVAQVQTNGDRHSWTIQRRFKNFDELHKILLQSNVRLPPNLRLPSKSPFLHNSREVVDRRKVELEAYLGLLLDPKFLNQNANLHTLVRMFLKEGPWENASASTFAKGMSVIRDSFRTMIAVPDQMMDNLTRMLTLNNSPGTASMSASSTLQTGSILRGGGELSGGGTGNSGSASGFGTNTHLLRQNSSLSNTAESSVNLKVGHGLEQEDGENIPMRILFLMLDEIFDLKRKNQLVRRSIINIARQLVKTFFGSQVNKMIVDKAQSLISASQLALLLARFRDTWWPPGLSPTTSLLDRDTAEKSASTLTPQRDLATRMRTRVVCRTRILGSVSEELSHFLGSETTRQGVQRLFNMCHNEVLNRRLVHLLLEGCVKELLSTRTEAVVQFYHTEHCPVRLGNNSSGGVGTPDGTNGGGSAEMRPRMCPHPKHEPTLKKFPSLFVHGSNR